MAWLPFYAIADDVLALLAYLNSSTEIAFIVSNGTGKWIAADSLASLPDGRHCLWHVPGGPLPLFRGANESPGEIANPFLGWSEARSGADRSQPYFGAGHPGVFWLNVDLRENEAAAHEILVGLSSFEWIGNHYRMIGHPAKPETEKFWKALGRWVKRTAIKVPRGGPQYCTPPEIWAFPGAQAMFEAGAKGAPNPRLRR